ncbi:helix-turn-helix transcriptional regulator [Nocardia gamkensis]|uniref:Helix-turn-helix domain-containing protein n=2 Tax=Nocardia TaxID=1817 RepID=A0A7X6R1H0_9NOCA|nr:helix-turn-helix transcriptional regulator [Nocardia gamkensis]NKY25270.1 helix-turn-helix domain-containing protein [Nocardia gamkensis]NQE70269.1 putative HTH-type transcriptional regulator [Nocardia gamkensis]
MESYAAAMVGRDDEQAQLFSFVTARGGRSLILRGETGVGKSALLAHAADMAERAEHEVLRVTGVEAESELPYAGLHQFLYPLLAHVRDLDEGSRAAFDAVFGQRAGDPPSVMTLGIAVLNLLGAAARERPLLLVLDDGQWLDAASAEVCGFVGRRLTGSAVKMLIALRADIPSRLDTAALPETTIPPLSEQAAARLLDQRHPGLNARTRRLTLEHARGNALALLELPAYIVGAADTSDDVIDELAVPLPKRLQRLYSGRITALPETVRAELLKGALDGVGARAAATVGPASRYRMRDAEEAVRVGLLEIDLRTGDFMFRHPLVRSAVVQLATPNQRRAAHAALARVHHADLERRARHLAAATIDPDEQVAAALEAAAESATRRGGAMAAVAWLTRAAQLSENHEDRSRRLGDAAFVAGHAARLGQAQRIVQSDPAPGGNESPAAVLASAYSALYEDGDVRTSHRRVSAAIEELSTRGAREQPEMLVRLVNLLLAISQYAGDAGTWTSTRDLLAGMGELLPPRSRIYRDSWSDVVRHGAGVAPRVESAAARLAELEPWDVTRLAVSSYHLDIAVEYRPHLQRIVDRELETGAVASGIVMLHLIMLDQTSTGEWDEAERTGLRSLRRAVDLGYDLFAHQSRGYLAQLAALRGRLDEARELQAVVDSWARPRGLGFLTQAADAAGTTAALTAGDFEAAYLHAIGITPPGEFAPYAYQASRGLLDLVEAAVHTGRAEEARAHAAAAWDAGLPAISPRLAILTFGATAMTADDDARAAHMVARAESHPSAARFPFELARIRSAHGLRLRHANSRTAARHYLSAAAASFDRLGAAAWAERARAELPPLGVSGAGAAAEPATLTWQERRIADLAAAGLSNKEIGVQLHLSPRTVGSHLYRIFPKLGITTRAALRDALTRDTPEPEGQAAGSPQN